MKKKAVSKKRVAKKSQRPLPGNAFYEHLEDLGMFEHDEPVSYMSPIYGSDHKRPVGWWQEIGEFGREGLACGEGPFWTVLEIVLPKLGLMFTAYSLETDDADHPSEFFYMHDVVWAKTRREIIRMPLFEGPSKTWRKYSCVRIEEGIRGELTEKPWLFFEFAGGESPNLAFEAGNIRIFLQRVANLTGTKPKDRKAFRRILEAIHALDSDGLANEIKNVVRDCPELEDAIRHMIPSAFHEAGVEEFGLSTAAELVEEFSLSGIECSIHTIRRRAKKLECRPHIGKHGRYRYDPRTAQRIFNDLNVE